MLTHRSVSTSLQLDLAGVGNLHFIQIGPETRSATLATPPKAIVPGTAARPDVFTVGHRSKFITENFITFAAFITALKTDLTPMSTAVAVAATGQFDSATMTFTAARIAVLIND